MKQLKSILIVAIVFLGTQVSVAQSKVAHIDVSLLMKDYPAMINARAQFEKVQKSYDTEYNTMVQEFQTKMKKYQTEAENGTATDAMNESRAKEMQDMESRIKLYSENARKELQQKEIDLLKPVMEKAQEAIQKVAKAKGVNYVLDATSPGTILFVEGGIDLLDDVKKELGY